MPKPLALILSGMFATAAVAVLSVFAVERRIGSFDRSAVANLSGAPLEPTTTGSVLPCNGAGGVHRKQVEHLDKDRLGVLTRSAGTGERR